MGKPDNGPPQAGLWVKCLACFRKNYMPAVTCYACGTALRRSLPREVMAPLALVSDANKRIGLKLELARAALREASRGYAPLGFIATRAAARCPRRLSHRSGMTCGSCRLSFLAAKGA